MKSEDMKDAIDIILSQWSSERPELDLAPMGTIGRLKRCSALVQRRLDITFREFGMSSWEFDVLATLRRSGKPYCLAPTELFSSLMITSGTMTNRLTKLEADNLIVRIPNKEDARSTLVQLTTKGRGLIDRAVEVHLENERLILASLKPSRLKALDRELSELLAALE